MKTSDSIEQLATALAAAQGEIDGAKKSASNPFFNSKYADLASVKDAMRGPFAAHGLSVVQFPQTTFSGTPEAYEWTAKRSGEVRYGVRVFTVVTVLTRLLHTSGQFLEESVSAMLPNGDPQSVGSAISYLRRYALQTVAGVASADDDGEATTRRPAPQSAPLTLGPRPIIDVALVPIVHPDGYLAWLDGFRATAPRGTDALEAAWTRAPKDFRIHLKTHAPDLVETLKAIAARAESAAQSGAAS